MDRFDLTLPAVLLVSVVGAAQVRIMMSEPDVAPRSPAAASPAYSPDLSHLPAIPRPGVPIFEVEATWEQDPISPAFGDLEAIEAGSRTVSPEVRFGRPAGEGQ